MQKIIPMLWFDKEAKEATNFYASVFPDSKVNYSYTMRDTPSGDADAVSFEIMGYSFMAISAGPYFKINPSISFTVVSKSLEELDSLWAKLSEGGKVLMEYQEYPFSKKYGWVSDKYGVSWQLSFDDGHYAYKSRVTPTLMYVGDVAGRAEEAIKYYASVFPDGKIGDIARYPAGMDPDKEGSVMHGAVQLAGQEFFAMDSARKHDFKFSEAVSLMVQCEDQKEIDYFWEKLSSDPKSEQCGWLKDKFGVSWQIVPKELEEYMSKGSPEQVARVTQAFLPMKKLEVDALKRAFEGK